MTYLPGGRFNATIGGNTAGAGALVSSGTLTLAGGNNITLSQAGNAITISGGAGGAAGSNTFGVSNLGNTSGTSGVLSGSAVRYLFAGGNNVTLSQSINGVSGTVTISAASQSVQTQNMHNVTLAGNTAGALAHVSSGTLTLAGGNNITLSQAGNAITISGGAGGGGGIALANSQTTYTSGTAHMVASGALTIGSTTGQSFNFSVPQTSSMVGAGGITLSTSGSTVSISGPVYVPRTVDFYQNMDRGTTASLATANGTLMLQRLNQENDKFAGYATANTVMFNMTANMTATSLSNSHSVWVSIGLYSDNATALSLINSATTSWAISANTGNTASYHGPRWLSFVSSQWSSAPVFVDGGEYVLGIIFRSSNYAPPMSYVGQSYMMSNQRSGYLGTSMATNTSLAHGNYWNAMYATSTTAFPAVISSNQVNRNNATAVFMPHVILNNRYSGTY